MKREVDIVIISDVHLGTYSCHAKELLNYLKSIKPKTLILNGDFIDMWQFKKRFFPKEHIQVIQRILKMSVKGTKVYYITGNHDDLLRKYSDISAGSIHLRDQLLLQLSGKKYWVFHGDVFDFMLNYAPFLTRLGGKRFDFLRSVNRIYNGLRRRLGRRAKLLARKVRHQVKAAEKFVERFETTSIQFAFDKGYDFVICGHVHRPKMQVAEKGENKVTYLNSGDWVEHLTALEYNWGKWTLYTYDAADYEQPKPPPFQKDADHDEDDEEFPMGDEFIKKILHKGVPRSGQ